MAVQERIQKYRKSGGASDLVRVEVLVPSSGRKAVLDHASQIRAGYRQKKAHLRQQIDKALDLYGLRILDNIDLSTLNDVNQEVEIVANALIERGDARAYFLGRRLLDSIKE
jgi:hypothetical protein